MGRKIRTVNGRLGILLGRKIRNINGKEGQEY